MGEQSSELTEIIFFVEALKTVQLKNQVHAILHHFGFEQNC
jgi:hypothetical protein